MDARELASSEQTLFKRRLDLDTYIYEEAASDVQFLLIGKYVPSTVFGRIFGKSMGTDSSH
eukprot:1659427-Pleurochrysis_carterae.AAC.1